MKLPKRQTIFLYFTACTANLLVFTGTLVFTWPSTTVPQLNGSQDPKYNPLGYPISDTQVSLLGSIYIMGAAVGPFLSGPFISKFGRRISIIIFASPAAICFVMKAFATKIEIIYAARFLGGLSGGSMFTLVPSYVAEISEIHNRGTLGVITGIFSTLASLYAYVVGTYTSIMWFSLSGLLAPLLIFLIMPFLPESPFYDLERKNEKRAIANLERIRSGTYGEILAEAREIRKSIEDSENHNITIKDLFASRPMKMSMFITGSLMIIEQFTGAYPVLMYLHLIFDKSEGFLSADTSSMLIGVMKLVAFMFTLVLVDRLGRKFLLMICGIGMFASLLVLGTYFQMESLGYNVHDFKWLPLATLLVYIVTYGFGLGVIPLVILGEIFPQSHKSLATIITITISALSSFIVTFAFPLMISDIGMGPTFYIFCVSGLVCTAFTYLVIPETKGKSFYDIQLILDK